MSNQLIDKATKKEIRQWSMDYILKEINKNSTIVQLEMMIQICRIFGIRRRTGPHMTLMNQEIRDIISQSVSLLAEEIEGIDNDPYKLTMQRTHVVIGKIPDLYAKYPDETQKLIDRYAKAGVTLSNKATVLDRVIETIKNSESEN